MAEIRLPLSITYETAGTTPIARVVETLSATDAVLREAIGLLPSLIDGLEIEDSTLSIRSISQASPLKEAFIVGIIAAFQGDLTKEVPAMLSDTFGLSIDSKHDSLVTVVFLVVTFYGATLAADMLKRVFSSDLPREKLDDLISTLSAETGKSEQSIRRILDGHFSKPSTVRKLVSNAKRIFLPSHLDGNAAMIVDKDRISSEVVRAIPPAGSEEKEKDFNRYSPFNGMKLHLHAQDRDKAATGWAAVAPDVSDRRIKLRVIDPVTPSELWNRDTIIADGVVVMKLTSAGFTPHEIQVSRVISSTKSQS